MDSEEWSRVSLLKFRNLSQDTVVVVLPNTVSEDLEPTKATPGFSMTGDYYIRKAGASAQGVVNYYKVNLDRKGGLSLKPLADVPDGAQFQVILNLN